MAKLTRKERRKRNLARRPIRPVVPIVPVKVSEKDVEAKPGKQAVQARSGSYKGILGFYESKFKILLIIPFGLLFLSLLLLGVSEVTTGEFVQKGISLKGGVSITVPDSQIPALEVLNLVQSEYPESDINVRILSEFGNQRGFIVESSDLSEDQILDVLEKEIPKVRDDYGVETVGSQLGEAFARQILTALLIAFVFMALVVFFYFRTFIPSLAVILAAASDMIVTLAVANVLGIKLSTAGIAAFLMLVGYSVDTDILLSTRVLKRSTGTNFQRVLGAMKTGLTMTVTTVVAITVGLFVSDSEVIRQIMTILLIGLLVDIINTWIQNVGIIRWYCEKKKIR
ncbi:protein translocase subunit SecF [Candidatus Woesearchaeota archaeon]|nr:protein translocase subunit SecF [Candidatus Woesearchaeota archaeon]